MRGPNNNQRLYALDCDGIRVRAKGAHASLTCNKCRAIAKRLEQSANPSVVVSNARSLLNTGAIETVLRDGETLRPLRQLAETWEYIVTKLDNPSEDSPRSFFVLTLCGILMQVDAACQCRDRSVALQRQWRPLARIDTNEIVEFCKLFVLQQRFEIIIV